jgi:hypothetical protein
MMMINTTVIANNKEKTSTPLPALILSLQDEPRGVTVNCEDVLVRAAHLAEDETVTVEPKFRIVRPGDSPLLCLRT